MDVRVEAEVWGQVWEQLRHSFNSPAAPEFGVLALVAPSLHPKREALIISDIVTPDANSFELQERDRLVFSTGYLRRAVLEAQRRRLPGLMVLHTHPNARHEVSFSPFDNADEPELIANLREFLPGGWFASVVCGAKSLMGRAWRPGQNIPSRLDRMFVVGDPWKEINLDGHPLPEPPPPAAMFDRALAVTGAGALARLRRMRVAIVGVSGTGSLMAELLVRAGVGELLLIDGDAVKKENLNRIAYSRKVDADRLRPKVEMLKERLNELDLGTRIEVVPHHLPEADTLDALRGVDLIFGCVDKHWPRHLLSRVAIQYVLPLIDLGTEIGDSRGAVDAVNARVSFVAPGRPCLVCSGVASQDLITLETLSPEERTQHLGMGYAPNFEMDEPAVMDLNMRAASQAMMALRHLLQPFIRDGLPVHFRESVGTTSIKADNGAWSNRCVFCDSGAYRSTGDWGPPAVVLG